MSEGGSCREAGRGESEAEARFWERYWQALRSVGVKAGKEIWHEREVQRFIRYLRPKRLREAGVQEVTDWLRLLAVQPEAEAWQVQQADRALRVLYQGVLRPEWAERWPSGYVGAIEQDSWLSQAGQEAVPVRVSEAEVRREFRELIERMVKALRVLHYSYRNSFFERGLGAHWVIWVRSRPPSARGSSRWC